MKILITGGGGFLGYRLALALLKRGALTNADGKQEAVSQIVLMDTGFPAQTDPRLKCVKGDFTDAALLADAIGRDTGSVFHLAAVVSGGAEADFDLGIRVNLDGTRGLLEACRRQAQPPRYVFASSVAAFGGELPPVLDDTTTPNPQTSYGAHKVCGEYLATDFSRKGYIDGRSLRLPTIVVRAGKPNLAASSFASGIIREPLNGEISACPVGPETGVWLLSPVSGPTGQDEISPFSGSRMMPLANEDAARLGLPARTTMVGSRKERPSMNPLRLKSVARYSPQTLCAPYEVCGLGVVESSSTGGSSPPKAATELANT